MLGYESIQAEFNLIFEDFRTLNNFKLYEISRTVK